MWRSFLAAAVVVALDRPLQSFHREVNLVARDGQRVLSTLDDARSMRYLKDYMDYMDAQLRAGNQTGFP